MIIRMYPWGYQRQLVTWRELKKLAHVELMEPEYANRLFAWIRSKKGQVGIGGAFRTTQPAKPGFAPDGKSFHQLQTFVDGRKFFMAVDLVCRNGDDIHRAPRWDEVPEQGSNSPDIGKYGVHCNVSGEPWHMQAIEVDGWQSWVDNGRKHPGQFDIMGIRHRTRPQLGYRILRLEDTHMNGTDVRWVQRELRRRGRKITVDGDYGPQTVEKVTRFQRRHNLEPDGVVGWKTWRALRSR